MTVTYRVRSSDASGAYDTAIRRLQRERLFKMFTEQAEMIQVSPTAESGLAVWNVSLTVERKQNSV